MKESKFIENVKQINNVGELKNLLKTYPDDTKLVATTSNRITELFMGTTHPVGDRDTEEETLIIFGGKEK